MSDLFINKIKKIILKHLEDEDFNVGKLALEVGLGRSQVLRKVKSSTGKTVSQFIKEIRLSESIKLLQKEEFTVSEISYKVGFSSPQYFNKCFNNFYGFPPGEFKSIDFQNINPTQTNLSRFKEKYFKFLFPLLALFFLVLFLYQRSFNSINKTQETKVHKSSIAILPFLDLSENENQEYFSDGMTDAITLELSKIDSLRVISRTSSMRFKEGNILLTNIAKELDVDYILEGSVLYDNDSVSIIVQLIDPFPQEDHIWQNTYNEKFENIISLIGNISNEIANEINATVLPINDYNSSYKVNVKAYNLYLKGRHIWNQNSDKNIASAIKLLKESIKVDSNFAPSYVTLAEAYITQNKFISDNKEKQFNRGKSRIIINKSLELDEDLGMAYITKGNILGKFDWDWEGMKIMLEKGLQIDPNNAYGHMLLSDYYLVNNDLNTAINEALIAENLDPLNAQIGMMLGDKYCIVGEYEKSIEQYQKILDVFPNNGSALSELGFVYFMNEQKEQAVNSWIRLQEIRGNYDMVKRYKEKPMEDVFRYWLEIVEKDKETQKFCTYPVLIAQVYMLINKKQKALEYLELAYKYHYEYLPILLFKPDFIELHNEPRFKALVKNTGISMNVSLSINSTKIDFKD